MPRLETFEEIRQKTYSHLRNEKVYNADYLLQELVSHGLDFQAKILELETKNEFVRNDALAEVARNYHDDIAITFTKTAESLEQQGLYGAADNLRQQASKHFKYATEIRQEVWLNPISTTTDFNKPPLEGITTL